MLGTFNPGQSTVNKGPKLACIEMTPYTLFTVIIYAYFLLAFWAAPLETRAVFYPDINSTRFRIKLNFGYFPWITKPKKGFIKFRISH